MERTAVVDSNQDHAAVGGIPDPRVARDRQRRVRRGHRVHVVDLAARRGPAMELASVPRGQAALAERHIACRRHVVVAEHLVRLVRAARADRLDARLGIGQAGQIGGRVRARPVGIARQRRALTSTRRPRSATDDDGDDRDRRGEARTGQGRRTGVAHGRDITRCRPPVGRRVSRSRFSCSRRCGTRRAGRARRADRRCRGRR